MCYLIFIFAINPLAAFFDTSKGLVVGKSWGGNPVSRQPLAGVLSGEFKVQGEEKTGGRYSVPCLSSQPALPGPSLHPPPAVITHFGNSVARVSFNPGNFLKVRPVPCLLPSSLDSERF